MKRLCSYFKNNAPKYVITAYEESENIENDESFSYEELEALNENT